MKRSKAATVFCFCLAATPAVCWPAGPTVTIAATTAQGETLVVRVKLNTEDKGDLFVERTAERDFLVKVQDLKAIGFKDPRGTLGTVEGEPHMSLRSMAGVSFEFREKDLALHINAHPQLLLSQSFVLEKRERAGAAITPNQNSLFANYALNSTHSRFASSRLGFSGELGGRLGNFLFLTDGSTIEDSGGERKFVRLMSSVTYDDREALRRTVAGDFFTPTREFSSGVNLGGISISKLYGLNPYFIQFPMQSISGNVALPSDLEVYIDGQRVRSERLRPGEFELRDIVAYGGARNVQVLLRDAFGRTEQVDYAFYFSDQPLRRTLHEYSYNLGAIRRSYGIASNRYGAGAFSMFHRYGVTDALTLGLRAEGTRELVNAGPIATVVLGGAGVAGLALAGSSIAGQRGAASLASYTYQSRSWGLGMSLRRDWKRYAALGEQINVTNRKYEASLNASYRLGRRGTISANHSFFTARDGFTASSPTPAQPFGVLVLGNRRVTTLSYSVHFPSGWAAMTAGLSHIKDRSLGSRNEAFVGLTIFLGKDYSVAAGYRGDKNTNSQSLQLTKQQPFGEGLGFNVAADRWADSSGQSIRLKSSLQYNAPAAIFRADLGRDRNPQGNASDEYRVSVAGGIGYVGGTLAYGRPITGSFGVVKVGELPGVGVMLNGQRIGETDAQGTIFVPTLSPYIDNQISIAAETVPIDYSTPSVARRISPSMRSGVLVEFTATKLQAFSGKLKAQQNEGIKPMEFKEIRLAADEKPISLPTGRGGEFYVENLKSGTYAATVMVEGRPCRFDLIIPKSNETFVDLGDVVCRPP